MQDLNIILLQAELYWEDSRRNLHHFDEILSTVDGPADLILLPEMFNTGFTMNVVSCAEPADGEAMKWLISKAHEKNCVVAGSILTREGKNYFNRFVWMRPDGTHASYDKRHLFTMAGEDRIMTAGEKQVVVEINGWKINLQVCYDLRFPVWSRNTYNDGRYAWDVLIYVANWPEVRKPAYQKLLPARAIENQAYVVWVNRVGTDGKGIYHCGDSGVYDPLGNPIAMSGAGTEEVLKVSLSAGFLQDQRSKFRAGPDWDRFTINE